MKDNELFEIWEQGSQREDDHKNKVLANQRKIVTQQSNDVFSAIKRNILVEGFLSIVVAVISPFTFEIGSTEFWLMLVTMIAALFASLYEYKGYFDRLKSIQELDLKSSLEAKVNILTRYVKRMRFLLFIFMPIGFLFGLYIPLKTEELDIYKILFLLFVAKQIFISLK